IRIAAEKLGGDRVLVFVKVQVALALGFARAEQAVGGGELRHQQAAAGTFFCFAQSRTLPSVLTLWRGHDVACAAYEAGVADETTEHRVGHAGHRSQDGGGSKVHIADLERLPYLRASRSDCGGYRIFPEFVHLLRIPSVAREP